MKLEMTKNELARNIKRNLKKVFANTMTFSVRSEYVGATPGITVQILSAEKDYFKTYEEYCIENQHLQVLYGLETYEELMSQFESNRLCALTNEVRETIEKLCNEFNYCDSDLNTNYYVSLSDGDGITIT